MAPIALGAIDATPGVPRYFVQIGSSMMDPKIILVGVGFFAAIEPTINPLIGPVCQPTEMCAPLPITMGDEPASRSPKPLTSEPAVLGSSLSTVGLGARSMMMFRGGGTLTLTPI
jgi:hypothetical protein